MKFQIDVGIVDAFCIKMATQVIMFKTELTDQAFTTELPSNWQLNSSEKFVEIAGQE